MSDAKINIRLLAGITGGILGGIANIFIPIDVFPLADYPFSAIFVITALLLAAVRPLLTSGLDPRKQLYIPLYMLFGALADNRVLKGGHVLFYAVVFFFVANEAIGVIEGVKGIEALKGAHSKKSFDSK